MWPWLWPCDLEVVRVCRPCLYLPMIWIWWLSKVIKAVKGQFQYLTLDVHYLTLRAKISLYNRKAARRHGQNFVFEFRFTLSRFTFLLLLDFMGCLIDKLFINLILHIVLHFQHLRCFRGCRIWHLNFHQKPARLHGADKSRLGFRDGSPSTCQKILFYNTFAHKYHL